MSLLEELKRSKAMQQEKVTMEKLNNVILFFTESLFGGYVEFYHDTQFNNKFLRDRFISVNHSKLDVGNYVYIEYRSDLTENEITNLNTAPVIEKFTKRLSKLLDGTIVSISRWKDASNILLTIGPIV